MEPETEQTNLTDGGYGRPEDSNSGDSDLNSLLAEYEEGTKPQAEPKTEPEVRTETKVIQPDLSKLDPVIRYAEAAMQRDQRETFEKDVDAAVDKIAAEESFKGVPKHLVRRMTIAYAFDNKEFDKAFQNRAENPTAWENALKDAGGVLAEEVKDLPRADETPDDRDDIAAAKATVDGVQDGQADIDDGPSVIQRANMSDTEWRRYLDERLVS